MGTGQCSSSVMGGTTPRTAALQGYGAWRTQANASANGGLGSANIDRHLGRARVQSLETSGETSVARVPEKKGPRSVFSGAIDGRSLQKVPIESR